MKIHRRLYSTTTLSVLLLAGGPALAVPFEYIRIGDVDGFGIDPTGLLRDADVGGAADTNGNGILQQTEYLPDWNQNGAVATGNGDDFDFRSASEILNTNNSAVGATILGGTSGSNWTDLSLSTSAPNVNWPDGNPAAPNEPDFFFRFTVDKSDITEGSTIFFNLIFGDYDVFPSTVNITTNDGFGGPNGTLNVPLTQQSNAGGDDGLIQSASLVLDFDQVFSDSLDTHWAGYLDVSFEGASEPYTAFDYVELSLDSVPTGLPDTGSTLLLLGGSLLGFGAVRRKLK